MIISVSGRIGHGKDEVGRIVQYLTSESSSKKGKTYRTYEEFKLKGGGSQLRNFDQHYVSDWEVKKFADKLKDIVCMLIGCTRAQLEDRDFKEKELGEEWWLWRENITGKLFPYYGHEINDYILIKLTPRLLLQILGTDCGRDIIHPNIWVNSLMSEYHEKYDVAEEFEGGRVSIYPEDSNWIITDTRFPNELKAIKDKGGISIKVVRYPDIKIQKSGNENDYELVKFDINNPIHVKHWEGECKSQHSSETALDNAEFDYVIDNNSSIEELIEKVREVLIKENIL